MDIKIIIKSMGKAFFIPFIINDILIPIVILFIKANGNEYNLDQGVYMITQMFTPFLASFWVYLHLTKYIDVKGNENFYVKNRIKLPEVLKLYILYIITNTCPFLLYGKLDSKYYTEWLHIAVISLVFVGAAYLLSYLLRSISLALIPSFIYMIATVTEVNNTFDKISFYEYNGMSEAKFFSKYVYFIIVATTFLALGRILNRHFEKYNL